jgi:F0F1-type ATP synthase epsilon subunit
MNQAKLVKDLAAGDVIITKQDERLNVTAVNRGFAVYSDGKLGRVIDYTVEGKSDWMQLSSGATVMVEATNA